MADLVILTHCTETNARFAAAMADRAWPRVRLCELSRLGAPEFVRELGDARGLLIHLPADSDRRDEVLRLVAMLPGRGTALAVLRDGDRADAALDAMSNLPPSTLRRLRALLASDRASAAAALLSQFALAAGLSMEFPQ